MALTVGAPSLVPEAVTPRPSPPLLVGLPLLIAIVSYPLAWLVGLELVVWPLVASLCVIGLIVRPRRIRTPRGTLLLAAFIAWAAASAALIPNVERLLAWGYRTSHYVAALIIIVFIVSTTERELPTARLGRAVVWLWGAVVIGGLVGLAWPDVTFPSLLALVLPVNQMPQFVADSMILGFGASKEWLGAIRPATFFAYTNTWAATLGLLTPLAFYGRQHLRRRWSRNAFVVLFIISLVPAVMSANRGLWVSLVLLAVGAAAVLVATGHVVRALSALGALALVGLVVRVSPLWTLIEQRLFVNQNLAVREDLVGSAIGLAARSPVLGYGTPTRLDLQSGPAVGTHGQYWTIAVSHGFVALALYVSFFVVVLWYTRRAGLQATWLRVTIIVLLAQGFFYSAIPMPVVVAGIATALLVREARPEHGPPRRTPVPVFSARG